MSKYDLRKSMKRSFACYYSGQQKKSRY